MGKQRDTGKETRGYDPAAEVVDLCRELIRIDTTNFGDDRGPGERKAAEYVAGALADVGLQPVVLESEPGRANVLARWEGTDQQATADRGALLVHGHLDVVPADASEWQVDPFSGEIKDGCIWGRGAVDMKDFDAIALSVIRSRAKAGARPARDVVLAFTADEEAGSRKGAHWLVDNHRQFLEGATEAVGEVGGFSVTLPGHGGTADKRMYMVQAAERGMAWLKLRAKGRPGHGSIPHPNSAVVALAETVARIGRHQWPVRMTATTKAFLDHVADIVGADLDHAALEQVLIEAGSFGRVVGATMRNSANPSMLDAGFKVNVVPGEATACVDGRFLPGMEAEFFETIDALLGEGIEREFLNHDVALETSFDGAIVDAMGASLISQDPDALMVPYLMFGGTDAKAWSRLDVRCFGFAPLRLPADLDFVGMFHGIDERVPVDALEFGARVFDEFLDRA